jgi:hypothetical protein
MMVAGVAESGPGVGDRVSQLLVLHVCRETDQLDTEGHSLQGWKVLFPKVLQSHLEGLPAQERGCAWPDAL